MTIIHRDQVVPFSAEEMFQLVDDVEKYPEFLPWCKSAVVHKRNEDECHATLVLERNGLEKSFSTCNRLQTGKMIEIRLVDGPFRQLEGFWRFDALETRVCRITLDLEFEFSNKLLALAFGSIFQQIASRLVESFCKRAEEVYVK